MKDYISIESDDYYDMACAWIGDGDYEKAEDCLLKAIDLNPKFTYAYITLARIYDREKKFDPAVHILMRASRNDPEFDELYYLIARYSYKGGNYKRAMKYIQIACDKNPSRLHLKVKEIIGKRHPF